MASSGMMLFAAPLCRLAFAQTRHGVVGRPRARRMATPAFGDQLEADVPLLAGEKLPRLLAGRIRHQDELLAHIALVDHHLGRCGPTSATLFVRGENNVH